ncbi:MAG TPA: PilZ domain-containing protein [Candidatus Sulfotelmatobacter sp.]|nr:PilZ domain-containing protein [Candidatus Sulfotelmatobacter sp.]
MTTPPVRVERRVGQRFPFALPVSLRVPATCCEGAGFTQDLSSRGVFFFTDLPLTEGTEIELTLKMPAEITLGESMPVRCRAHVLRVLRPLGQVNGTGAHVAAETKIGVAVRLESYEYLQAISDSISRVSTLHPDHDKERLVPSSVRSA